MKDYNKLLENVKNRRTIDLIQKSYDVSKSFSQKQYGSSITYVLEAMRPISEAYTQNTYKACERIQGHIKPGLKEQGINVSFDFQGSVLTDTHIKVYSDVDMLLIQKYIH